MGVAADPSPWRFCVAPMMDWTTSYCRQFHRQLTRHARLYTEMVTTGALLHGDAPRFLEYAASEQPLALQLGGSEPDDLARTAEMGGRAGYVEINLNCGCPSDRVQEGRFGACLMREPERVAQGVAAMRGATDAVITVKHRVGVDDAEDYPFMRHFVETVAAAGCEVFIVHARKAWLQGLSPKENREVPPLTYEHVYRLKQDFPSLTIVINGGIATLEECSAHLAHVDGVMLGRAPYERPWLLADVDRRLFARPNPVATRDQALLAMAPLMEAMARRGESANRLTRHLLGLYRGQSGGKAFRRHLSEHGNRPQSSALLREALAQVQAQHPRV